MKGLAIILVLASSVAGQTSGTKDVPVTVVAGESWLNHLQRSFDETSMGKTGRLGPPPPAPGEEPARWQTGLAGGRDCGNRKSPRSGPVPSELPGVSR